ncbi:MAG TPA: hypothetical protein VHG91_05525 [Longimicrobium sp.]|nr:hypothetical protein [Longimicrobium sp.]
MISTKRTVPLVALALVVMAGPARAQEGCPVSAPGPCATMVAAAEASRAQIGILAAGGNPAPGTASTGGVRLGFLPRVSAGLRLNAVRTSLPEVFDERGVSELVRYDGEESGTALAVGAHASVGLYGGRSLAPTVGGFGALDLLADAALVPVSGGTEESALALGVGARVGLVRESFATPGASVSLMYRRVGEVRRGNLGDVGPLPPSGGGSGESTGEVTHDVRAWSARAVVSKRLLALGLTAGAGYDRFTGDDEVVFRAPLPPSQGLGEGTYVIEDAARDDGRWSLFASASYGLLLGSLTAEAGWMQGGEAPAGYPATNDFDPEAGTLFGSLAVRISL